MKRLISASCIFLLVMALLVGCATKVESPTVSETEKDTTTKETEEVSTAISKKATINLFQNKPEITEQLVVLKKEYEESHPGITLEIETVVFAEAYTALKTKFASNEMPDIFSNEGYQQLDMWIDNLEDLSDQPWVKDIIEVAKDSMSKDGKTYGLPLSLEGYGYVYNKDLFAKANITELPKTLSELKVVAEKLESKGITPFANALQIWPFLGKYSINNFIAKLPDPNAFIKGLNDGTAKFSDYRQLFEDMLKNVELIVKHGNKDQMTTDNDRMYGLLTSGECAMFQNGNWTEIVMRRTNSEVNVGLMPIPINDDVSLNDKLFVGVPTNWVIYKNSKAKTEAKEFLNWLVTSDAGKRYITKEFKFIPAFKSIQASPEDIGQLGQDVQKYISEGKVLGWHWQKYPDGAIQEFNATLQKYIVGKLTSDQVLIEFQETWDKLKPKK